MKDDIRRYDSGFYSSNYPVFPLYIKVLSISDNYIYYEIKYSDLGYREMMIQDGMPSEVKPLWGI